VQPWSLAPLKIRSKVKRRDTISREEEKEDKEVHRKIRKGTAAIAVRIALEKRRQPKAHDYSWDSANDKKT